MTTISFVHCSIWMACNRVILFKSIGVLVGSCLSCIQNFPCSVTFWGMFVVDAAVSTSAVGVVACSFIYYTWFYNKDFAFFDISRIWVFDGMFVLIPFCSIYHYAKTFIPRKTHPMSIWFRMGLTQIINLGIQRFSPWHTHKYQYLIGIIIQFYKFWLGSNAWVGSLMLCIHLYIRPTVVSTKSILLWPNSF